MATDLDHPYPLTTQQIANYRRDGLIRLKDVFDADALRHYGEEITRRTIALNMQTLPLEQRSTYGRAFLQVMNLWQDSDTVRKFVFGKRLAGIAAALMEVDGVRPYHDQSLYKEPGGGITPAHADQYYLLAAGQRPHHHRVGTAAGGAAGDGATGVLRRKPARRIRPRAGDLRRKRARDHREHGAARLRAGR